MRLTEKSQVTIPKAIREKLGIGPGSEVDFLDADGRVEIVRADRERDPVKRRAELERHLLSMRGTLELGGMTTDEYIESVRGPRADLDPR